MYVRYACLCSPSGSGIGTLTFGPVLQHILHRYGLATSLRILSGVTVLLMLTALTYKPLRSPLEELFEVRRHQGSFIDMTIWRNKAFCVYTAAVSLFMLGYFIPYVHLVGGLLFIYFILFLSLVISALHKNVFASNIWLSVNCLKSIPVFRPSGIITTCIW